VMTGCCRGVELTKHSIDGPLWGMKTSSRRQG